MDKHDGAGSSDKSPMRRFAGKPRLALAMRPDLTPDLLTPSLLERMRSLCDLVSEEPLTRFDDRRARDVLARVDALVTGWGCPRLDEAALRLAPDLRFVGHTGSSVKLIADLEVWRNGIVVVSAAAANAIPVAEFALAAVLMANKRAFQAREHYRTQRRPLRSPWTAPGEHGNYGATVGVIGASRTGRHLLSLLGAFNLEVLLHDPYVTAEEANALGARLIDLDELLRASDVVTIHAPAITETRHMLGRRELAAIRDGATIVNTARGTLIDQRALEDELAAGRLFAVLDVTDPEPLPEDSPLLSSPHAFVTPHIAGAAGHETQRMTELVLSEIQRFVDGAPLRHEVTVEMLQRQG